MDDIRMLRLRNFSRLLVHPHFQILRFHLQFSPLLRIWLSLPRLSLSMIIYTRPGSCVKHIVLIELLNLLSISCNANHSRIPSLDQSGTRLHKMNMLNLNVFMVQLIRTTVIKMTIKSLPEDLFLQKRIKFIIKNISEQRLNGLTSFLPGKWEFFSTPIANPNSRNIDSWLLNFSGNSLQCFCGYSL